jgi:hypothetical protein
MMARMTRQQFSLIMSGVAKLTPRLADALYEATGGDVELSMTDGVAYLEFERSAESLDVAIKSAIADVEGAGVGVRVIRVESESANTIARINASLLGVSNGH